MIDLRYPQIQSSLAPGIFIENLIKEASMILEWIVLYNCQAF